MNIPSELKKEFSKIKQQTEITTSHIKDHVRIAKIWIFILIIISMINLIGIIIVIVLIVKYLKKINIIS